MNIEPAADLLHGCAETGGARHWGFQAPPVTYVIVRGASMRLHIQPFAPTRGLLREFRESAGERIRVGTRASARIISGFIISGFNRIGKTSPASNFGRLFSVSGNRLSRVNSVQEPARGLFKSFPSPF